MSTGLKITAAASIEDVNNFVGLPCKMSYILNSHISIDITCPVAWTMDDLPTILAQSFIEPPVAVHLLSITILDSFMN